MNQPNFTNPGLTVLQTLFFFEIWSTHKARSTESCENLLECQDYAPFSPVNGNSPLPMGQPSIPLPWIANTRHTGLSAGPSDKLKGRISNLRSPADAMHASGCSLDAACSQVGVDCVGHRFFLGGIKAVYWTSILTHNLG